MTFLCSRVSIRARPVDILVTCLIWTLLQREGSPNFFLLDLRDKSTRSQKFDIDGGYFYCIEMG